MIALIIAQNPAYEKRELLLLMPFYAVLMWMREACQTPQI